MVIFLWPHFRVQFFRLLSPLPSDDVVAFSDNFCYTLFWNLYVIFLLMHFSTLYSILVFVNFFLKSDIFMWFFYFWMCAGHGRRGYSCWIRALPTGTAGGGQAFSLVALPPFIGRCDLSIQKFRAPRVLFRWYWVIPIPPTDQYSNVVDFFYLSWKIFLSAMTILHFVDRRKIWMITTCLFISNKFF